MDGVWEFLKQLNNPEEIIQYGGIFLVLAIIFLENGAFFAFFLPGDTLLFTAGLLVATDKFKISVFVLIFTVAIAGIIGSLMGYFFGLKTGESFSDRKESLFFKKSYIESAQAFFDKYGGRALILARFLPIIRTFMPILAGMVKYKFSEYFIYNIIGALAWVFSMILGGFFLGRIIPNAKDYLEFIIIGIMIITWIPVIVTYFSEKKNKRTKANT